MMAGQYAGPAPPTLPALHLPRGKTSRYMNNGAPPHGSASGMPNTLEPYLAAKASIEAKTKSVLTAVERDRIAREKAARVKKFMEERDLQRPPVATYMRAMQKTLYLHPKLGSPRRGRLSPRRRRPGDVSPRRRRPGARPGEGGGAAHSRARRHRAGG